MDKSLIGTIGRCAHCTQRFVLQSPNNIYCSPNCMIAAQRLRRKTRKYNSMRLAASPYQDRPVPPSEELAKEVLASAQTDEEIKRKAAAILAQEEAKTKPAEDIETRSILQILEDMDKKKTED